MLKATYMRIEHRKTVDPLTGRINLSPGLVIERTTLPADIVDAFPPGTVAVKDIKNGWKHYTVRNIQLQGKYFYFTLFFFYNMLNMVSFGFTPDPAGQQLPDGLHEEAELQKAVDYNNWLDDEIGLSRLFSWGTISAGYDAQGRHGWHYASL